MTPACFHPRISKFLAKSLIRTETSITIIIIIIIIMIMIGTTNFHQQ